MARRWPWYDKPYLEPRGTRSARFSGRPLLMPFSRSSSVDAGRRRSGYVVRDTSGVLGGTREIALSGLIGALSYALDLTEGEPPGHAARSCLIGMRVAEQLGLGAEERSDLFYALLLKDAGCSANSARMAALFAADDHEIKRTSKRVDWSRPFSAFVWSLRTVASGKGLRARAERLRAIHDEGEVTRSLMQARCDRGAEIARMLGFSEATAEAIRALDEHWDGRGQPRGLRGTEIPLAGRILCLAQTIEVFHRARGVGPAYRLAVRRSGHWFDPALVDALSAFRADAGFWESLAEQDLVYRRATRPRAGRRREPAGSDRRCVCCDYRREVAVDPSALRSRERDRDRYRRVAGLGRGRAVVI